MNNIILNLFLCLFPLWPTKIIFCSKAQVDLKLPRILKPQSPKYWKYGCEPLQ